jgi:FKBP-type peptidyl-prolyl cis-trans isomerase 2
MVQAKSGDTVRVQYTGKLNDGKVFDTSVDRDPLQLTIGEKRVIPAFEEAVIGMERGESKTVKIPVDEAYGQYHKELVQTVDRGLLPEGLEPKVGQRLTATHVNGETVSVTVADVSGASVTIDANHPLAGEDLTFDIELVEIL